jgi:enoyl reductase
MSKTVIFDAYGEPDVLHIIEADPPVPGAGQVRVAIKAAGVQPFDCLFRSGAAHPWMPAKFPQRLGNEFAGVVDAIGRGVTGLSVGEEVLGWALFMSYAEHVLVGPEQLLPKPAGLTWPEAGVMSASGQTASTAISALGIGNGDTFLIHAAAGGVGSFGIQIANALGARVIGTASERNHGYLRSLGAVPVAYGDGLVQRVRAVAPEGVSAALIAVNTEEAVRSSLELVSPPGRVATVAFAPLADTLGIRRISTERSAARLNALLDLYTSGKLKVNIQRTFPLTQAPDAHRVMESGHVRGKLALMTERS